MFYTGLTFQKGFVAKIAAHGENSPANMKMGNLHA